MALSVFLLAPGGAVGTGSGSLTLLIVYIALAIGVSFLCSILEAVLLSVSPAYIGNLSNEKPKAAERLKGLKADVERPLAAILSLNTVAHTIGAAGAGAEAAAYFGDASIGIFSAILTLGILVLSEIIPKTLGAVYWRGLAPLVGRVLPGLIWLTIPLVWLSQGITKLIARGEKESAVSREEIAALAQIGHEEGIFDKSESRILASLLRFNELTARDVMTPRTVTVAFDEDTPLAEVAEQKIFSRVPVYTGSLDEVTGYVLRDEVLGAVAEGNGETPVSTIRRDVLSVAHDLPLPQVFEQLLDRQEHLAIVAGEYGGTEGVVTVEDVIETLLDVEIVDEVDTDQDMQAAARQRWERRARKLGLVTPPEASGDPADRQAVIGLGLTGGTAPSEEA
ncbi:MAG: hemolysin family protein [Bacteroidota bacterium]